jgi:hypothetical protein
MMRIAVVSVVVTLFVVNMAAQEAGKTEIFGGFSHESSKNVGFNGWIASADYNPWSHFGVEGDVSGHYGSQSVVAVTIDWNTYNFDAGPRVYATSANKFWTVFGHALFGVSHQGFSSGGVLGIPPISQTDNAFSWIAGGGVDISITSKWAGRAQLDFVRTHFFNGSQSNGRYSFGVVYRF